MKQWSYHRYVLKINTSFLKELNWDMKMSLYDMKKHGLLVELAESECIRMMEQIANVDAAGASGRLREIKRRLNELKKMDRSRAISEEVKKLLDERLMLQFLPEYVCLVCDNEADFHRAREGFLINGLKYYRLTGTSNGIKKMTIVFVSELARNGAPLLCELRRRIDNGRDLTKEFIPAKLEAYRSLICSATAPLSNPRGVIVVKDCVTRFFADYIKLSDDPDGGEPVYQEVFGEEVELDESDGYGLMSPGLARTWSRDLRLNYLPSGICIRNSFCKGMVFCFDFHAFAEEIAGTYSIFDAWGEERDIRDADLILTVSQLKLWDSYRSVDHYLENCAMNGYCWGAAKVTPEKLEHERELNYQFLQSYRLKEREIASLIAPTLEGISDAMGGDYEKCLLFLRGTGIDEANAVPPDFDWITALSADKRLIYDPFIRSKITNLLRKRIKDTKIGNITVNGNFSVVCGDPFALCQSMFGLKVTGLLKAGEIYSKYWSDRGSNEVACFRAPMSCHNNIRKLKAAKKWSLEYWYRYLPTVTLLNAWDQTCAALNGCDKDGDLIFLTDNKILVENIRDTPVIQCEQKNGVKCVPDEEILAKSNAIGFGDNIGKITNRITAMTEIQSMVPPDSVEYQKLEYRIQAGQHLQQAEIDRIKGIVSVPMRDYWYKRNAAEKTGEQSNVNIVADRKPYFMIYRYDDEYRRYKNFISEVRCKAIALFGKTLDEIAQSENITEEERSFVDEVEAKCPVLHTNGTMNQLCRLVEKYFENRKLKSNDGLFDASILKSGRQYSRNVYHKIKQIYEEYQAEYRKNELVCKKNMLREEEKNEVRGMLLKKFRDMCISVCTNEQELADILVDMCYQSNKSKSFVWQMCGEYLAKNAIRNNGGAICYLKKSRKGSVMYRGELFEVCQIQVEDGADIEKNYSG